MFRQQKTLKKTRIKLCNTLVLPVLFYGSEIWTVKASEARRITAAEKKHMRRKAVCTASGNTNVNIGLKMTRLL